VGFSVVCDEGFEGCVVEAAVKVSSGRGDFGFQVGGAAATLPPPPGHEGPGPGLASPDRRSVNGLFEPQWQRLGVPAIAIAGHHLTG